VGEREQDFPLVLREVMEVLEPEYEGMIIGGVAVIAWGHSRATADIDVTMRIPEHQLAALVERFAEKGIVPRIPNALDFARSSHVLLMRHRDSQIDIDLTVALLPFEEEAIAHRQSVDFAGVRIAIPRPEDLVIYKMIASRPQDMQDVEELLLRYYDQMDLARVRRIVGEFAEVLERPELVQELERAIVKAAT
jgi:predicted nucleotidyltransferase